MNDAVDLAAMVLDLVGRGAAAKLCRTCLQRCGVGESETIVGDVQVASMGDLVDWLEMSDRALSF